MIDEVQMTNSMNNLNNVAVEYFGWGLKDLSYQIWDGLYRQIQDGHGKEEGLLPVVSCNMGNALRHAGAYEEAYRICRQGLRSCFETGEIYAMPELMFQLSTIHMKMGRAEKAKWLYSFGKQIVCWSRKYHVGQTMEEMMGQDFLLYCKEDCCHDERNRIL